MPHYLALTYTEDLDWTAPEQAGTLAEYRQFGEANRDTIRSAAVLHPTATATVVRVVGARGGDVVTADGPYAETKEALTGYYIIEAADLDAALDWASKVTRTVAAPIEVWPFADTAGG